MKTISITLNEQQLSTLSAALVELPFKIADPLIRHINAEIQKAFDREVDSRDENVKE